MSKAKLKPLEQWICDHCGEVIESSREAYVIWHPEDQDGRLVRSDFRIIHQGRCDDENLISSAPIRDFLGVDGIAYLTSFLTLGPALGASSDRGVNNDQFADFFRRVQVPYYEEARRKFQDPEVKHYLQGSSEVATYLQEDLKKIAEEF